jgi:Fe-S-cluster containining protein
MENPKRNFRLPGKEKQPFYYQGLYFSCLRCSVCCRYESGYVFLSKTDLALLASCAQMRYTEFMQTYCRWVPSELGLERLSLKEKSGFGSQAAAFDCIFWGSAQAGASVQEGCTVYEARPLQCRAFPFWTRTLSSAKNWKETAADCPGMGKGAFHSSEVIESWLKKQEAEPVLTRNTAGLKGGN